MAIFQYKIIIFQGRLSTVSAFSIEKFGKVGIYIVPRRDSGRLDECVATDREAHGQSIQIDGAVITNDLSETPRGSQVVVVGMRVCSHCRPHEVRELQTVAGLPILKIRLASITVPRMAQFRDDS